MGQLESNVSLSEALYHIFIQSRQGNGVYKSCNLPSFPYIQKEKRSRQRNYTAFIHSYHNRPTASVAYILSCNSPLNPPRMAPHNLQSPSSDSMATTMTLTDPEKAAHATSPKPGTPERQVDPARASGEFEDPVKAEKLADDAGSDDDINYPTGLPLAFITIGLCLAVFLVALDQTIIATAIPRITG